MSPRRWWFGVFFVTLTLGSVWLWNSRVPLAIVANTLAPEPAIGHPAPEFVLPTLTATEFALGEQNGMPIVLNFWATWCGPCRRELPALQAATERYAGQVQIVGVDQGEDPETVARYVDELGLTFVIPLDTEMTIGARYNIRGMPTTFFIDADGIIRRIWTGEMNSITLAEGIAEIIR